MDREAIQRLREPAAWILVGTAAVSVLGGLFGMFLGTQRLFGVDLTFVFNSANVRDSFIGPQITALPVVAILLATHFGERLPRARTLVQAALGVLGSAALLGAIAWLAGLASQFLAPGARIGNLLYGAGELALVGIAIYFGLIVLRGLPAPPKPAVHPQAHPGHPGYPGYPGYPQQGAPGQPSYPGYPAQPGQPGAPGQPGQPGQQPGGHYGADYGQGAAGPGAAPGQAYGGQAPVAPGFGDYAQPPPGQGPAPGQPYGSPGRSGSGGEGESGDAGLWTHAFGGSGSDAPGESRVPGAESGHPGVPGAEPGGSPYGGGYGEEPDAERPPPEAPGGEWGRS